MNKSASRSIVLVFVMLLLIAGGVLVGWRLGRDDSPKLNPQETTKVTQPTVNQSNGVRGLITYTLPDKWTDMNCPGGNVFISTNGSALDCASTTAPVQVSIDSPPTTDCNQLDDIENETKHTCKSLAIAGKKALESSTTYNDKASANAGKTSDSFYIDTGKGIVKIEYLHDGAGDMTTFRTFVESVRVI